MATTADFLVVGAGSAGCALVFRLSEDGRSSVHIVEHGGSDAGPLIQMPAAFAYPMGLRHYDWGLETEPEPHLGGRRLAVPRGKVIGGSSSINGMVYVRGHARDYDAWAAAGGDGWSFASVLPYFQRLEASHGGEDGWRGAAGPVHVTRGASSNPLYRTFIEAGRQAGFELTADYNGSKQEGFAVAEQTIWQGRRWSAASAYLRPALKRPGVGITRALARRVIFEGRRAVGVEVERGGKVEVLRARRAVILAASAINSPKLLLASGIGPAAELKALGIDVVADRRGVGRNLQDHLEVYVQFECRKPVTLHSQLGIVSKALIGARWLLLHSGPGATNHFEAVAFVRSRAGIDYPDIQYHFLPAAISYDGRKAAKSHGFQVHVGPMRSKSRGAVTIRSADPLEPPRIVFNYMSHPDDWAEFRHCVRLTREIVRQPAFAPYAGVELSPGVAAQSDAEIDAFVRDHVESAYHPCGTCRMGAAGDPDTVVDPTCKVVGVDGLYVADSSVIPIITNGNLNAPSMMVGEKAADHILGRGLLPSSNLAPWINPRWRQADR